MEPTEIDSDIDIYGYVMSELQSVHTERGYQDVADGSGVPKSTVKKIKRKEIIDPGVSHVQKIATFFRRRAGLHDGDNRRAQPPSSAVTQS